MTTAVRSQSRPCLPRLLRACVPPVLLAALLARPAGGEPILLDGVAAYVNETPLTVSEVLMVLEPARRRMARRYSDAELKTQLRSAYEEALNILIDRQVILANYETRKDKLKIADWPVERRIKEILHEQFKDDRSALMKQLTAEGLTYDDWRKEIENQIVISAMRQENVRGRLNISPAALTAFYEAHRDRFRIPGKVKLRMIAINKGQSADTNAARRQEAAEIRKQAEGGADFAELARTRSNDSTAAAGGEWDWIEFKLLKKELADAAQQLEPGQISDLIETGDAFYVLKCEGRKDDTLATFEAARPYIERGIERVEEDRLYMQWIRRLRDAASIKVLDTNPFRDAGP